MVCPCGICMPDLFESSLTRGQLISGLICALRPIRVPRGLGHVSWTLPAQIKGPAAHEKPSGSSRQIQRHFMDTRGSADTVKVERT